jgi:hypothetical protein
MLCGVVELDVRWNEEEDSLTFTESSLVFLYFFFIRECDRKKVSFCSFFFKKANNYIHSWQMERIVLKTSQNKNRNHGRRTRDCFAAHTGMRCVEREG